jgi:hypothetical protein
MNFKGPLQILRLWRSWGKTLYVFFQNRAYIRDTQGIVIWNLELGKLGAPYMKKSLRGRNFQESNPLILEFLSHMHIQIPSHPWPSKNEQNEKVYILFWITPV